MGGCGHSLTTMAFDVTGLPANTKYWVKVCAGQDELNSAYTEPRDFITDKPMVNSMSLIDSTHYSLTVGYVLHPTTFGASDNMPITIQFRKVGTSTYSTAIRCSYWGQIDCPTASGGRYTLYLDADTSYEIKMSVNPKHVMTQTYRTKVQPPDPTRVRVAGVGGEITVDWTSVQASYYTVSIVGKKGMTYQETVYDIHTTVPAESLQTYTVTVRPYGGINNSPVTTTVYVDGPKCSGHTSCRDCAGTPGCGWCDDWPRSRCQPSGPDGAAPVELSSGTPCNLYSSEADFYFNPVDCPTDKYYPAIDKSQVAIQKEQPELYCMACKTLLSPIYDATFGDQIKLVVKSPFQYDSLVGAISKSLCELAYKKFHKKCLVVVAKRTLGIGLRLGWINPAFGVTAAGIVAAVGTVTCNKIFKVFFNRICPNLIKTVWNTITGAIPGSSGGIDIKSPIGHVTGEFKKSAMNFICGFVYEIFDVVANDEEFDLLGLDKHCDGINGLLRDTVDDSSDVFIRESAKYLSDEEIELIMYGHSQYMTDNNSTDIEESSAEPGMRLMLQFYLTTVNNTANYSQESLERASNISALYSACADEFAGVDEYKLMCRNGQYVNITSITDTYVDCSSLLFCSTQCKEAINVTVKLCQSDSNVPAIFNVSSCKDIIKTVDATGCVTQEIWDMLEENHDDDDDDDAVDMDEQSPSMLLPVLGAIGVSAVVVAAVLFVVIRNKKRSATSLSISKADSMSISDTELATCISTTM